MTHPTARCPHLIGVSLGQDSGGLLMQGVSWRPTQDRHIIAVKHDESPGRMGAEMIVAGTLHSLGPHHPQLSIENLHPHHSIKVPRVVP